MIEDKQDGIKIAVNPVEELWARVKSNTEIEIKNLENSLILSQAMLEMATKKLETLKEFSNGQNEQTSQ